MKRFVLSLAVAVCAVLAAPGPLFCQTSEADQASPEQVLAWADREFDRDSYKSAETLYRKVITAQPNSTHALARLALLLTWEGEYKEAIALYNAALAIEPSLFEARRGLATAYCWSEQYPMALRVYKDLLSERPADEGLLLEKAQAEAWSGDLKTAGKTLDDLLGRNPRHVKGRVLQGQVRQWGGDLMGAETVFRSVIVDSPGNAPAEAGLCEVLNSADRSKEAMPHCDAALALDPKNKIALTGKARALQSEGRTPEALNTVREALDLYPDARDARRLGREIGGPLRPTLKLFGNTLQDNDDNDLATWGGTYTHYLGGRGYVGVSFTHAQTDAKIDLDLDPSPVERTTSATPVARYDNLRIIGGWHQSKYLSLYAEAGIERTSFPFPEDVDPLLMFPADPNSFVTDESASHPAGSVTIEVNPTSWFTIVGSASVERLVGTTQAFMNDIGIEAATLTTIFQPHRLLRLRLTAQKAKFTDDDSYDVDSGFHVLTEDGKDNERDLLSAGASLRLPFQRPAIFLNYNYRRMSYDHDLDQGYFNPQRFLSHEIGFDISDTIGEHFYWGGGFDRGIQWINHDDSRDVLAYRVLAGVNVTDAASIEAYYARSDSSLAAATGFKSSEGGVRVRISFGGSLGPASPTGGGPKRPSGASD